MLTGPSYRWREAWGADPWPLSWIAPVAPWLLRQIQPTLLRRELIWADTAYLGPLQTWVWQSFGWHLTMVERPGGCGQWLRADQEPPIRQRSFHRLPHRWVVERTFGWIGRSRRMGQDDEFLPATSETWIYLSMVRLMLKRLAHAQVYQAFQYRHTARISKGGLYILPLVFLHNGDIDLGLGA
jgi:transposase